MEYLNELKEKAMKYSLADLKRIVKGQEPLGRGMEGEVYDLDNDLVVKFRRGVGAGYNQRLDNLAEFQRQAIHDYANDISGGKIIWEITNLYSNRKENISAKTLDILACFVDGDKSVSISPFIEGSTLEYDRQIIGMADALRNIGIVIDGHGENIMRGRQFGLGYIILETWGRLYPNSFKILENIDQDKRNVAMKHLARAHLYGGTSRYPIPHEEMTLPEVMMFRPINWHDVSLVSAVNGHKEITYKDLKICLSKARKKLSADQKKELSLCGLSDYEWEVMGLPAIWQAKEIFGKQFIPVPFDWENGTNLDIYGINPEMFQDFRREVDSLKPQISQTLDSAKRLMKKK